MKLGTVVRTILSVTLLIVALSLLKCALDTRTFVAETQSAVDTKTMSQREIDYRVCLKRKAGMVGVVSTKQMQKCKEETGYGK